MKYGAMTTIHALVRQTITLLNCAKNSRRMLRTQFTSKLSAEWVTNSFRKGAVMEQTIAMPTATAEFRDCTTCISDPDTELVQSAKRGDISAFEELVRKYDRKL